MASYGAIDVQFESEGDLPIARSVDHLMVHSRVRRPQMSRADSGLVRRPYLPVSTSQASLQSGAGSSSNNELLIRDQNMAIRYRLFNRLDPGGSHLMMPAHVIPAELFSILPFDEFKDIEGKQGSIVTIFSIWNTMMGTSLLAFYTAYRVIESPHGLTLCTDSNNAEFSDVCRYFWGKHGEYVSVFFSIVVLLGGAIVYFVLMSNFLFYTGNIVHESLQPNSSILPVMANKTFTCDVFCPEQIIQTPSELVYGVMNFDSSHKFDSFWKLQGSVPIYLAILTFPLLNFKSPTFFTKFNVLGTVSVIYLIIFTFSKMLECGFNMNFVNANSPNYAKLFSWKFPALTGTLSLSYFIHNAILTILRNQKHPENNVRDLSIGYVLSALCYLLIGTMFFVSFPTYRNCISDNFLNNFGTGDVMSATARVFLLFQMFTVLPLLLYLIRVQFSYVFAGTVYPGLLYVCLINFGVVTLATFFAVVYPHVGSILRYVGSFSGMIYIFTLPCLVHLKRLKLQGRLTRLQIVLHSGIIVLGVFNLISQFLI
ncbi:transmembrane amino acid transporter protein domain-containing protein [Ditylenchus destructor]|uniref:Transmembrane amino acid transporter protein domain-containing protein n=1 Tax=Ditylenchus destructor TaxID=166010 RepID=A0AAD4RCS0_9BILA|nr:transmembrane amino acid transporter protein domain-containing protein [Ditylenchus destructor]